MPVGHHETVLADDHSGTQALIHDHSGAQPAPLTQPRGTQTHDRRRAGVDCVGVAGREGLLAAAQIHQVGANQHDRERHREPERGGLRDKNSDSPPGFHGPSLPVRQAIIVQLVSARRG